MASLHVVNTFCAMRYQLLPQLSFTYTLLLFVTGSRSLQFLRCGQSSERKCSSFPQFYRASCMSEFLRTTKEKPLFATWVVSWDERNLLLNCNCSEPQADTSKRWRAQIAFLKLKLRGFISPKKYFLNLIFFLLGWLGKKKWTTDMPKIKNTHLVITENLWPKVFI